MRDMPANRRQSFQYRGLFPGKAAANSRARVGSMARCLAESAICRLCSGIARFTFSEKLLGRYTVSYFRCTGCECLQTEQPYWLTEAYAGIDSNRDTGAVKRCLYNFALTLAVSRVLNVPRILDYGGGH